MLASSLYSSRRHEVPNDLRSKYIVTNSLGKRVRISILFLLLITDKLHHF